MKKRIKICASVACADLLHLSDEIRALEEAKVDYLHYDIMDGVFVPNITFGFDVMKQLKKITDIPIDCHLMIQQPEQYISEVAASGASAVAVHAESDLNLQRALSQIHAFGLKAGVVLNPATPLDVLDYVLDDIDYVVIMTVNPGFAGQQLVPSTVRKISDARQMFDSRGYENIEIMTDGNVSFENVPRMISAGATLLVAGTSSLFRAGHSIADSAKEMHLLIEGCIA